MDFITNLPISKQGESTFNGIFTIVDRLTKFVVLVPVYLGENKLTANEVANLFYDHIICKFGIPSSIVSDRDPRFTSHFWEAVWRKIGTKLLLSSSYHP